MYLIIIPNTLSDVIQALAMRRAQQEGTDVPYLTLNEAEDNSGDLPWLDPFSSLPSRTPSIGSSLSNQDREALGRDNSQLIEPQTAESDGGSVSAHLLNAVDQLQLGNGGQLHSHVEAKHNDLQTNTQHAVQKLDVDTCCSSIINPLPPQELCRLWTLNNADRLKCSRSMSLKNVHHGSSRLCLRNASSLPVVLQSEQISFWEAYLSSSGHSDGTPMSEETVQADWPMEDNQCPCEDSDHSVSTNCEFGVQDASDLTSHCLSTSTLTVESMPELEDGALLPLSNTDDVIAASSSEVSVSSSAYYTALETLSSESSTETVTGTRSDCSIGSSALTPSISRYAV